MQLQECCGVDSMSVFEENGDIIIQFKDEDEFRTSFFGGNDTLYFEDLCEGDDWTTYVINFVEKTCGASNKSNATQPDGVTPQQAEKESTTDTE